MIRGAGLVDKVSYTAIYDMAKAWHMTHKNPKTDDDWNRIAQDFSVFNGSEFSIALGIAILDELERVYKRDVCHED